MGEVSSWLHNALCVASMPPRRLCPVGAAGEGGDGFVNQRREMEAKGHDKDKWEKVPLSQPAHYPALRSSLCSALDVYGRRCIHSELDLSICSTHEASLLAQLVWSKRIRGERGELAVSSSDSAHMLSPATIIPPPFPPR